MMAGKALLFDDDAVFEQIMASSDSARHKSLGRTTVRNFGQAVGDSAREQIFFTGCYAKISIGKHWTQQLLDTGTFILAETSPHDLVWGHLAWGCAPHVSDPRTRNVQRWPGINLFGLALMCVCTMALRR